MKESRQQKILEIIEANEIFTQEGLLEKLREAGFSATQATVSRDIKRMDLRKKLTPSGKYIYTDSAEAKINSSDNGGRFKSLFSEAVLSASYAMNIAVIKCHTGMGNAVCAALDLMEWESVVGTLAGDDTIFALLKTEKKAEEYVKMINTLVENKGN